MCIFNRKKRYKRYARRMENSIIDTLKLEGCALNISELSYRSKIPKYLAETIIKKLIREERVFRMPIRDPKTGRFSGSRYCEFPYSK